MGLKSNLKLASSASFAGLTAGFSFLLSDIHSIAFLSLSLWGIIVDMSFYISGSYGVKGIYMGLRGPMGLMWEKEKL